METINRNVRERSAGERSVAEQLVGHRLSDEQNLVIQVLGNNLNDEVTDLGTATPPDEWTENVLNPGRIPENDGR